MTRSCGLAALFLLTTCWMTALAQGGGGDPDAKGTVSVSVEVKNGVTTITVTRDASAGWSMGEVNVYGIDPTGGYIYNKVVPFKTAIGDPPAKTGSVNLPLPNGTFIVWANHTVSENPPGMGKQTVGSSLSSVTVTNSTVQAETPQGSITCVPVRTAGGGGFTASGKWGILNNWTKDSMNEWIYFDTVPTGGWDDPQISREGCDRREWRDLDDRPEHPLRPEPA